MSKDRPGCGFLAVIFLFMITVNPIVTAFVLMHVWTWFLAPVLQINLTMTSAWGLMVVSGLLKGVATPYLSESEQKKMEEDPYKFILGRMATFLFVMALTLLLAYGVHRLFQ